MTDIKQAVKELREALYRGHSRGCPIIERIKEGEFVDIIAEHLPAVLDRLEKVDDCGEDGACGFSPGCNRHWEERNRELVAERDAIRARFLEFREAVDQWVGMGSEADEDDVSALQRVLDRFPVNET